jgi:steroid delta-isomerase-like uncharacterized protein
MIGKATSYGFTIMVPALLISTSLVTTGCNTTTSDRDLERNKSLVRHMNDQVWNKGNLDLIDELYAPDFVRHFLPDGSQLRGTNSLRVHVREHREAFPDWREEIRHIVAEGDLVVLHFVSTGTNEGSWLGNPATGRKIRIHEVSILRIEDGRIAEQWLMPDIFSMQQQLTRTNDE